MSIIERAIRLPVTVSVIVALVLIFGIISLFRVPIELTPNVDQPVVTVTTEWFGASPTEVVREIVERQEEVLKTVSGLREMTSTSSEGEAVIRLQFSTGVNKDAALNEVRDKLRQVRESPVDADQPVVEATDRFNRDYIAWLLIRPIEGYQPRGALAPGYEGDVTKLGTFVNDFVKPVLERAEGVSEVNALGGREREMQVRVSLDRLAARGIAVDEFVRRLREENADVTAGTIDRGKRSTSIRVIGQYTDPTEIENTVVAYTRAGAPVYVRDVATVEQDFKKEIGFVRSKGVDTIAINVQRETGSNVLLVMDNLKAAIADVNESVFAPTNWGLEVVQVYDQTVYIKDSVGQASRNLLIGAGLAGCVLFLTLRSLGATAVVVLAIPICVIGTFLGMNLFGRSLNVISMAGLTFAIGMGIDNAIVVLENIFRHREMGKDRIRAAIDGAGEVWGAIVAATLTNVAVFLPIIFIQEEAGQLFRDISIALTISFFLYLFVAPTVIPLLTTMLLRRMPASMRTRTDGQGQSDTRLGHLTAPLGRAGAAFSDLFRRAIFWLTGGFLRRAVLVVVFVGVSVLASLALIPDLDYLPSGNQNMIFGFLLPPPGYSVDEFRSIASHAEARLKPWWQAEQDSPQLEALQQAWRQSVDQQVIPLLEQQIAGRRQQLEAQDQPPERIDAAVRTEEQRLAQLKTTPPPQPIDNLFFGKWGALGFMGVSSRNREIVSPQQYLLENSVSDIPGVFGHFQQATIFRVGRAGTGIELSLRGVDNDQVTSTAGAVFGALMQAFNTFPRPDPPNFNLGRPETRIEPDRVRAAAAGVSTAAIRQVGQVAVDGQIIGDYRERGRSIDLTVMSNIPRDQQTPEDLADVPLATRDGSIVPLANVARFVRTSAPQQINRVEEQPAVSFNVQLPPGMTIQEAQRIVTEQVEQPLRAAGVLPPTVRMTFEGSADKLNEFLRSFIPGFILAAVITFLLLASLFENFIYPLVIILSVPFAMVGGFLGLAVLHWYDNQYVLNILTMLGFVILIGTIINNPILIVHQALNFMRAGESPRDAIAHSTQTRVRPIFMSVTTSVAGITPLVLLGGAGSELYRGLGAVVIGGLLLSTVFTLFLTPALMSLMLDLQSGVRRLLKREGRGTGPRPPKAGPKVEDLRIPDRPEPAVAEPVMSRALAPEQS